ncbi:MAG: hypothetical protein KatS3mg108_1863 [Isosphaeraceae bacterium]|nr:MAG: hypothetical protein KatS3mg108_1863 [Isosphaeraceae bacterium]
MAADNPRAATSRFNAWPHHWARVDNPAQPRVVASHDILILGAGPAGLTAAYELTRHGRPCAILEADPHTVGGISRTETYKGYRFDIGGHRFFSKSDEINRLWSEILGEDFLIRPRLSRIYYDRKFFHYPLRPLDALLKLGPIRSARILASYARARLRPIHPERSFEDWVVNRFGRLLFDIFFKTYTEKVWGMPTSQISADWAAQRIKGLSLTRAALNALLPRRGRGEVVKTLIDQFHYPRLGPGQMWESARDKILAAGGSIHMDRKVIGLEQDGGRIQAVLAVDSAGNPYRYTARHVLSTLPIRHLIAGIQPAPPEPVRQAAASLRYRDFLTVVLIVDQEQTFPDNWIYIHEPKVRLGRIQNFKNWSPDLVPDPRRTSLGLEYFCFEGDQLWTMPDPDLIALGTRELDAIGLVPAAKVVDGCVVRMPKAYPVYDDAYQNHLAVIRQWLREIDNLELAGRNGMHKYNNQDHSMMTGLLAARNILGLGRFDTWKVNTDAEYHEEADAQTPDTSGRAQPRSIAAA